MGLTYHSLPQWAVGKKFTNTCIFMLVWKKQICLPLRLTYFSAPIHLNSTYQWVQGVSRLKATGTVRTHWHMVVQHHKIYLPSVSLLPYHNPDRTQMIEDYKHPSFPNIQVIKERFMKHNVVTACGFEKVLWSNTQWQSLLTLPETLNKSICCCY